MMCKTCLTARINLHNDETGAAGSQAQTSYLSQISQIISMEKNLSCGETSDFCKEFEQIMEFYQNLCRFRSKIVWRKICVKKISVEKKMTNTRFAPRVLVGAPWGLVQHFSQDCLGFLSPQVPRCVLPCHFLAQKGIKRELFWHHDLNIRGPCMWLEC